MDELPRYYASAKDKHKQGKTHYIEGNSIDSVKRKLSKLPIFNTPIFDRTQSIIEQEPIWYKPMEHLRKP